MSVAAAIWAHPVREVWAKELQGSLDRPTEIIYDENPVPSEDKAQRWAVCVRVMEHLYDKGEDWSLWLQDDALVCRDFLAGVEAALDVLGDDGVLSPYAGTGRPDQHNVKRAILAAKRSDVAWWCTRSMNWGVAVAFPTRLIPEIIERASRPVFANAPSDYRVGVVLRDIFNLRTWYLRPSLAEHRDEASLVGHDRPGQRRVAHDFIGVDASALSVDWTRVPRGGLPVRT